MAPMAPRASARRTRCRGWRTHSVLNRRRDFSSLRHSSWCSPDTLKLGLLTTSLMHVTAASFMATVHFLSSVVIARCSELLGSCLPIRSWTWRRQAASSTMSGRGGRVLSSSGVWMHIVVMIWDTASTTCPGASPSETASSCKSSVTMTPSTKDSWLAPPGASPNSLTKDTQANTLWEWLPDRRVAVRRNSSTLNVKFGSWACNKCNSNPTA
mmetsp:Transcript_90759/g.243029  ORF Transcript_90759/g.243029 Transcript_90759/m.243029 type:complete len:212 (-) Transcript_90759:707-1342(-)